MGKKMKGMTVLGTRPEIIRLSEVMKKCDEYFEHIVVHTGQNYDYTLNQVFFENLKLREPDYYLDSVGNNMANPCRSCNVWRQHHLNAYCIDMGSYPVQIYNVVRS